MASVSSILCGKTWESSSTREWFIEFNQDGTGRVSLHIPFQSSSGLTNNTQLCCRIEFVIFIDAIIEWKPADSSFYHQMITDQAMVGTDYSEGESATFSLEITLTKQPPAHVKSPVNDRRLNDAAFEPKIYTLCIEKGIFPTTHPRTLRSGPVYELRLTLDPSPFPPRNEWKASKGGHIKKEFWKQHQFFSGVLSQEHSG